MAETVYPYIASLNDVKSFEKTFADFLNELDEHETVMFGTSEFPVADINYLLTVGKDEIATLDTQALEDRACRTAIAIMRIDIHTNRLDCILRYLRGKGYKAMSLIPPGLLNNKYGFEGKLQSIRCYPLVTYIIERLEFYEIEKQKFDNISTNMNNVLWSIRHKIEHETTKLTKNSTENIQSLTTQPQ